MVKRAAWEVRSEIIEQKMSFCDSLSSFILIQKIRNPQNYETYDASIYLEWI